MRIYNICMPHSFHYLIIKKIWTKARVLVIKIFVTAISNYITSFRQIFEPGQTETNVVVIVIEAVVGAYVVIFFWRKRFGMQTMRVPVGRVPQNKTHM
jgi:ABC-type cobalt transport system substrate-binding protein